MPFDLTQRLLMLLPYFEQVGVLSVSKPTVDHYLVFHLNAKCDLSRVTAWILAVIRQGPSVVSARGDALDELVLPLDVGVDVVGIAFCQLSLELLVPHRRDGITAKMVPEC